LRHPLRGRRRSSPERARRGGGDGADPPRRARPGPDRRLHRAVPALARAVGVLAELDHLSDTRTRGMRRVGGVCFDLDGTLVDTERLQWQAYRRVLAEYGADLDLDTYRRHFIAVAGGAEWACRRWTLPLDAAALRVRKAAVYRDLIAAGAPAMPGARTCLER